ncbi:hypothetical protein P5673_025152 [Acropora cervicornis]|uniref:Uncharacterized protein n=1 Tax=Acropora cervicornis TaxID=6130 RepID=A0AAD9Q2Z1_ACRCE|nr:hypothetical protein P5673_025152 [Acropora cervicornis]
MKKKNEEALCELRSEILQEVALTHPICYDICELIANSKLSNFAIQIKCFTKSASTLKSQ